MLAYFVEVEGEKMLVIKTDNEDRCETYVQIKCEEASEQAVGEFYKEYCKS